MLRERDAQFEEIDLNKGLSVAELDKLIGGRDYRSFLNSRNELYRERGMKENPPPRDEALRRTAARRPELLAGLEDRLDARDRSALTGPPEVVAE